jgi:hypothetical protein
MTTGKGVEVGGVVGVLVDDGKGVGVGGRVAVEDGATVAVWVGVEEGRSGAEVTLEATSGGLVGAGAAGLQPVSKSANTNNTLKQFPPHFKIAGWF